MPPLLSAEPRSDPVLLRGGKVGERIAAPGVTVIDDGGIAGQLGSLGIDDEGTAPDRTVLVEDGVLTLGPLATTRMMGPPELMAEERVVLEVLSSPLTVVDAPVLEPAGPDEAEQVLEDEGGSVLEEIVTLEAGGLTLRLTPDRRPTETV